PQVGTRLLCPAHAVGFVGEIKQHPTDRDQAFADLGGEIALAPDGLQDLLMASCLIAFGFEYRMRYLVDLCADPLEDVGRAVNHGVEQLHQHRFTTCPRPTHPAKLAADDRERARLVVAHCDEPVPG